MGLLESALLASGLFGSKALTDSMKQSKTLTAMVIVGVVFFIGFAGFLFYMASR